MPGTRRLLPELEKHACRAREGNSAGHSIWLLAIGTCKLRHTFITVGFCPVTNGVEFEKGGTFEMMIAQVQPSCNAMHACK